MRYIIIRIIIIIYCHYCRYYTDAVQNSVGGPITDELGPSVGQLGTALGHFRAVSDYHVGRIPFLSPGQVVRGR